MGEVARRGIIGGRTVPVHDLMDVSKERERILHLVFRICEEYDSLKSLRNFNFGGERLTFSEIAGHLAEKAPLRESMALCLLQTAPLPLLMKYVELFRCVQKEPSLAVPPASVPQREVSADLISARPLVLVPLRQWIEEELHRARTLEGRRELRLVKGEPSVRRAPHSVIQKYNNCYATNLSPDGQIRIARKVISFLESVEHHSVRVVFDDVYWDELLLEAPVDAGGSSAIGLARILSEIAESREGLMLHGPSVEDLVGCICRRASAMHRDTLTNPDVMRDLETILLRLKSLGFSGLRSASSIEAMKLVRDSGFSAPGFTQSLITSIDRFPSDEHLVAELTAINQLAHDDKSIHVWVPGWSDEVWRGDANFSALELSEAVHSNTELTFYDTGATEVHEFEVGAGSIQAARDHRLLRTLAVGALFLDGVPYKRASNRFLSISGLQLAFSCGANEFGFGAYDQSTAESLQLHQIEQLSSDFLNAQNSQIPNGDEIPEQ